MYGSVIYSPGGAADTYLRAMAVRPSPAVASAVRDFIGGLVLHQLWGRIDIGYLMNLHTEQASRLNIKLPGRFTLTDAGTAPTWATGVGGAGGFTANGAILTTGWDRFHDKRAIVQDSAHVSVRSWTSGQSANVDIGISTSLFMTLRNASDAWSGRLNGGTTQSTANTDASGLHAMDRSTGAGHEYYRGGALVDTDTQASTGFNAVDIGVLGGTSTTVSSRRQSWVSVGSSLGAAGHAALYALLIAFEAAIGAS